MLLVCYQTILITMISQPCKNNYTQEITKLVTDNPFNYSKIIRNNSLISSWLASLYPFTKLIPEQVYALLHPKDSAFCNSGNKRKFRNITDGWNRCNDKNCPDCITRSKLKAKNTCLEKYGVDNPMKDNNIKQKVKTAMISNHGGYKSTAEKRKQHYLEKYGVDHYWKTTQGQLARKQTLVSNYGVENPSQSAIIQQRKRQLCLEKYGVSHPMQLPEIKNKCVASWMEKYNVSNPSYIPAIREKATNTIYNTYGSNCYIDFSKKAKQTCISKYGVPFASQNPDIKLKSLAIKQYNFFVNLNSRNNNLASPNFNIITYQGVNYKYSWKCNVCNLFFTDHINNGKIPKCSYCFPKKTGISSGETELSDYIKSLGVEVILNSRLVIGPKEIDIYIPSHKIAIEYNGIYYHSEVSGGKLKNYHLDKTNSCKAKGITLIHVYDTEWVNNQELVKSRIAQKLGISTKIYARKCTVASIKSAEAATFLNIHHIQGSCNASINFGLFFNNELVAVMTFGKSRYSKFADYELLRFCSKMNTTVVGGAGKLLKQFEHLYNTPTIVSYCDLRYNVGAVYTAIGFTLHSQSNPNYKYHKNGNLLESRMKYQKHKLRNIMPIYDSAKSEWENMKLNGYDRIWDCGNLVFLKNIK